MSERPDLEFMWLHAFDDTKMTVKPNVRYAALHEERCLKHQHLQAVVFSSPWGRWVAYRAMRGARDVWVEEWLDEAGEHIVVTCHCDRQRRVDLNAVRAM